MQNKAIRIVSKAIGYIEEHLTEKPDPDLMAAALHYSKFYLHRIFTRTTGLTVHEYARRRQLTEAAKLLVFSGKPILEIALLSGYESQQSFSDIFRAMYKTSPARFREAEEFYPLQLEIRLAEEPIRTDFTKKDLVPATPSDLGAWMDLVSLAVGAMAFSPDAGTIDFLAVHPQYRRLGITKLFLDKLMDELMLGREISLTTYRAGDRADTGYRREYSRLGFAERELLIEYGYPTQRFVLSPENRGGLHD